MAIAGLPAIGSPDVLAEEAIDQDGAHSDDFLASVARGDVAAVSRMLDKSPDLLYARDERGQSAYLIAAYARQHKIIALLEGRGLRLDIHEACGGARIDEIKRLLHGAPCQLLTQNAVGDTPLHTAAKAGASATLDNVIGYGPDFSIANRLNETVAHLAVGCPQPEAAEAMTFATIGNAADPNARTKNGDSVMHVAARSGNERIVLLLLQKGADVDSKNANGQTAIDVAAESGREAIRKRLATAASVPRDFYERRYRYKRNFDALVRDDTNGLPSQFVNAFVLYSHFSLPQVKKWVEQCPDLLNTRASWDELSVEAAAHMGRKDIGRLMLDRGAAYSLATAVVFGSLQDVKRMLSEEPRCIRERGAHSFPLLWYTAFGEPNLEAAQYLIGRGADVREEMRGRTALHVAATSGHMELCRFFLECGLDPLAAGSSYLGNQTAVKAAQDAGHGELAKMLSEWKR